MQTYRRSAQPISITGTTNDRFSRDISAGRDINGDGIDDLVVGLTRTSYTLTGMVKPSPSQAQGMSFHGPLTQDMSSADADQVIYGSREQSNGLQHQHHRRL